MMDHLRHMMSELVFNWLSEMKRKVPLIFPTVITLGIGTLLVYARPIMANPVTPLENRADGISFLLALLIEIILWLVLLYMIGISVWRTVPVLTFMNLPTNIIFRSWMDMYLGGEIERWWHQLPYPMNTSYAKDMERIVSAELVIMLIEGMMICLFMKWSWLRRQPFRSLSCVNALGISLVANTISALMPFMVNQVMGVSTFEYVKIHLLSP